MTAIAIFNSTLKRCFNSKIYIKYCDFVPRYYGKQFIVYHLLCIIHCVSVLCVRLKNRKY